MSDSVTAARTVSSITSYGTLTANSLGNLTINLVNTGAAVTINSAGVTTVGNNSGAVSTINSNAQNTISGQNGVNLYNANVNVGNVSAVTNPSLVVYTNNGGATQNATIAANVKIQNVTVNGSVYAYANSNGGSVPTGSLGYGTVTLSNVVETSAVASLITANTTNGGITLTGVTQNRGVISAYAGSTTAGVANTIALTSVTNNSNLSGNVDSYVTNNGGITIKAQNTVNSSDSFVAGWTASATSSISTTDSTSIFGGALTVSTGNGSITLTGITTPNATATNNAISATIDNVAAITTANTFVKITSTTSDLAVASLTLGATGNASNNFSSANNVPASSYVTITSTGNVSVPTITAPAITLTSGNILTIASPGLSSTSNTGSTISITALGDVSTANIGTYPNNKLTLVSSTGNVNLLATAPATTNVVATATTGNVNVSASLTTNGLTFTAGNSINENTGQIVDTGTNGSATVSAPSINLVGNNTLPTVKVLGGLNGATINTGASTTTNIAGGTNVAGNLTVTTVGPISIGATASDSVSVTGFTTLSTLNSASNATNASITTASNSPSFVQGVSALTWNSAINLGVAGGTPTFGQISASSPNSAGSVTIISSSPVNLGVINTPTLSVTGVGITQTSGNTSANTITLFSGTPAVLGGAQAIPAAASLNVSSSAGAGTAAISLNLALASSFTLNDSATGKLTVNGNNQNLSAVSILSNAVANTSGNVEFDSTNGTIGSIAATSSGGTISYITTNVSTPVGAFTTNLGGLIVTASGSGGLGNITYNLGNSVNATKITNNTSYTISNLISSPLATGAVTVSANSTNTAPANLTIGSNVVLQGSGAVTLNTGNSSYGTLTDGGLTGSYLTLNALGATTTLSGKTISITSPNTVLSTVAITSNGKVSVTENGNITLGNVTIDTQASGANTFTSVTGNINATGIIAVNNKASSLVFNAATTGNNGVTAINGSNAIISGATVSITASGNSAIVTGNDATLSTIAIYGTPTSNYTDSQLSVTATGNIQQATGTSVYVWGATNFKIAGSVSATNNANAGASQGVLINQGANNFGAITIDTSAVSTANATIVEAATSTYNQVKTSNWTATSSAGDVSTATTNSAFAITGNSTITALKGNIAINGQLSNVLEGGTASNSGITLNTGGNAVLTDSATFTTLKSGSYVGGNLSITNNTSGATIQGDQAGSSGVTIVGVDTLLAPRGNITMTSGNSTIGGLITQSSGYVNVSVKGNLLLPAGSNDTGTVFLTASNNVSTAGTGSKYAYLTITSGGNVTFANSTSISGSLTINDPSGTVNLSGLSQAIDLFGTVVPSVTANTYVAPGN